MTGVESVLLVAFLIVVASFCSILVSIAKSHDAELGLLRKQLDRFANRAEKAEEISREKDSRIDDLEEIIDTLKDEQAAMIRWLSSAPKLTVETSSKPE